MALPGTPDAPHVGGTGGAADRHATWLELFFDLVFVVGVAQLAGALVHDTSLEGFGRFAALFVPLWWGWVGFTFFATRFDCEITPFRLLWLAGMMAAAAMAVNIEEAFDERSVGFALSYASLRLALIALYLLASRRFPMARELSRFLAVGFGIGTFLWYASVFVPEPARFYLWAAGMAVEILTPLFGSRVIVAMEVHPTHLPGRFGLFMIIVLGESVASIVSGTAHSNWDLESSLVAATAFVAAASVWWSYFDFGSWSARCGLLTADRKGALARDAYSYGHFPIAVGLTMLAAGAELAILAASSDSSLQSGARWALFGGVALYLLSISLIHALMERSLRAGIWAPRIAAMIGALLLGALAGGIAPLLAVSLMTALLVAYVAVEAIWAPDVYRLPRVKLPGAAAPPTSESSS